MGTPWLYVSWKIILINNNKPIWALTHCCCMCIYIIQWVWMFSPQVFTARGIRDDDSTNLFLFSQYFVAGMSSENHHDISRTGETSKERTWIQSLYLYELYCRVALQHSLGNHRSTQSALLKYFFGAEHLISKLVAVYSQACISIPTGCGFIYIYICRVNRRIITI